MYSTFLKELPDDVRRLLVVAELRFATGLARERISAPSGQAPTAAAAMRATEALVSAAERLLTGILNAETGGLDSEAKEVRAAFATLSDGVLADDAARIRLLGSYVGRLSTAMVTVVMWLGAKEFSGARGLSMDGRLYEHPEATLDDVASVMESLWASACRLEGTSWGVRGERVALARREAVRGLDSGGQATSRSEAIESILVQLRHAWRPP